MARATFGRMGRARSSRAVVQTGTQTFEVHEFERPAVGPDDAVLRMELCGICGSDIEQYDGRFEERGWVRGPTIRGPRPPRSRGTSPWGSSTRSASAPRSAGALRPATEWPSSR